MKNLYFERDLPTPRLCPFGIFVNQAGYLPESRKRAVMTSSCERFSLVDENGNVCFEGDVQHFGHDDLSGDNVYFADFSAFKESGSYRVKAGRETSAMFRIGADVYDKVFDDVTKAFYYLRCGCELTEEYAGVYRHAECHTGKAKIWETPDVEIDVSGGWHDAGDYGRYTTAGACALAHLLYAYRLYPEVFGKQRLNIPKTGMPDILAECRYELEWLLKMQREDGGVYHKVTTMRHAPFVMPEEDTSQLYVFPVSSMAAADFAAVCALAAGVYKAYDGGFSEKLKAAAEKSARWLDENEEFVGFHNPEGCNTGGYGQMNDHSNRYWAYAELYALTGDKAYYDRVNTALEKPFNMTALGFAEMGGMGSLALALCEYEVDEALRKRLIDGFYHNAVWLTENADKCGYGSSLTETCYVWGSNMLLMKNGMVFAISDYLTGTNRFREYAAAQLDVLLGVNALGFSYVTGTGEFCCSEPHLRPAFADGIDEAIPGMVAGGPNRHPGDEDAKVYLPEGTPPMKCYVDDVGCYSLNEITIYWNSPTVFVLAALSVDS